MKCSTSTFHLSSSSIDGNAFLPAIKRVSAVISASATVLGSVHNDMKVVFCMDNSIAR